MNEETKKRIADINNGIIPEGYKKTKVGIVPVEWDIKALGKISQFLDNQRKPVKENERSFGIYPYYGASGIIDYVDDYLFDGEYVLLGEDGANIVMRSSPLAFKVKGKIWINNHAHVISPNDNCNIDYLVNILESLNYEKYNSGTAQPKLNREVCESITIPFPPLPEQQKIAEILGAQDKLIELQARKIEQLKTLKKGYLQKMFPKKGCKYPELRFKGFTDAWEQREFRELYRKSSEKNDGSIGTDRNITVASMQFKEDIQVSSDEYLKTYYTFNLGDIAFEGHHSKEFKFGRFVENDIGNGIVSHIFAVFRPIGAYDLYYWKYAINNEYTMQKILSRSTKASTMMHDLVTDDFLKEKIAVPSLEEQRQIGSFLNGLDNLITLHQRKLDEEKQKKKALMQLLLTGKVRVKL